MEVGYKLILDNLRGLTNTNGMMLFENNKYRSFTEIEYSIFKEYCNLGLDTNNVLMESSKHIIQKNEYIIYKEAISKFEGKTITESTNNRIKKLNKINEYKLNFLSLLTEEPDIYTKKIKNPETGNDIQVKTALSDKDHPAHDKAKSLVDKHGGDSDGEHHDDHGDHHDHHDDGLSAKEKVLLGAADVVLKKLPIVNLVAGQSQKIYTSMKKVVENAEQAEGVVNKSKAIGKSAAKMFKSWGNKAKEDFVNSMTDANTGQRKKIGAVLKDKAVAVGKGIINGLKEEGKHILHELKDGKDAIKEVVKNPSVVKDPEWRKKAANGVKGLCTTAVIGMAIASGPVGMSMKAANLALNPGDVVRALLVAHLYRDLGGKSFINEASDKKLYMLIEAKVDSIDETFMFELLGKVGSHELNKVESPMSDYNESEMNDVMKYTQLANEVEESTKLNKKG